MTKSEMKELALLKWNWIVENWDCSMGDHTNSIRLAKAHPELEKLQNFCSYCEYYKKNCKECPLGTQGFYCCPEYDAWLYKMDDFEELTEEAIRMRDKIKNLDD
ncbi:MAG: hypothetical protein B6I31_00845 [Desulfobacteraceae bacterium 4572_19]|nr:MAG: hypothetical protein B6I31_00845 [Desulfobacteraceae bacterium 4572_19]